MYQIIILLVFISNFVLAKDNTKKWFNISQQQYINKLVKCQTSLDELKWSYQVWPKENKTPKPAFSEIADSNKTHQTVLHNLKMQSVLSSEFDFEITSEMLQYDLNRMVKNTRDAKRLKEMFDLLSNDATTIAECISRPYLVQKKFISQYNSNKSIHAITKTKAQTELNNYLLNKNISDLQVEVNELTYIKQNPLNLSEAQIKGNVIELNEEDFSVKNESLITNKLIENDRSFTYTELLDKNTDSLKIKKFTWYKQGYAQWLSSQPDMKSAPRIIHNQMVLPKILDTNHVPNHNTQFSENLADSWDLKFYEPTNRFYHTTVWTGSEMIIWGGNGNTGGRYNPVNDYWLPTSRINAPIGRGRHKSVWTGTEMIIWGGPGSDGITGGRYDPITDSWRATSTGANVPIDRVNFTAIWSGTEMIVWGGFNNSAGTGLNDGARYNPDTDIWTPVAIDSNTPNRRNEHTAVWTGSEMIIWGGFRNNGGRYNPVSDSWIAIDNTGANVPQSRGAHTAVWTGSEMIIWGGQQSGSYNTGGRYNPVSDSWTPTSIGLNVPNQRNAHTAVWTGEEMIIWGGFRNNRTGGRYNPVTDSWLPTSTGTNSPGGRYLHTAVWSGSEMLIWGGFNNNNFADTGARYNPSNDSWVEIGNNPDFPTPRWLHKAVWTGAEMLVWGGSESDRSELDTGYRYNPTTDIWLSTSEGANTPIGRRVHTAIWTGAEMIIWGGFSSGGNSNTGGRYNPLTDSWVVTSVGANVPSARSGHTAVWTGSEMIVWSGDGSNTGGKYNPASDIWEPTNTVGAPLARNNHTAVWSGSEMIIWGGLNSVPLNTGGRYSPINDTWEPTIISSAGTGDDAPISRRNHSVIWTGTEMIVWGGRDQSSNLNSGGRYNPQNNSWTNMSVAGAPSARIYNSMVWTGNEAIVWGGATNLDTGGRYDPINNSWQPTSTGANLPSPRYSHGAVWTGSKMLVWGGRLGSFNTISRSMTNSLGIYSPYNTYAINGTLTGFNGDQVVLQYNGNAITLMDNGDFVIDSSVIEGTDYNVSVITKPQNPTQVCSVTNGIGSNIMTNINVTVSCVNTSFNVGVTVTGLESGNSVILENNGGDALEVSNNNVVNNFSQQILDGSDYLVTFNTQPSSPNQICTITAGQETGTIMSADVNIAVTCATVSYNVGVTVTGLETGNSVILENNGGDALEVSNNSTLNNFSQQVLDGSDYLVTFNTQPSSPNQICAITAGQETGTIISTDINITVTCATLIYNIGVLVTGLEAGNSVILENNGGDALEVSNNSVLTNFSQQILDGSDYLVTINSQPSSPNQHCRIATGQEAGIINGLDVVITVSCETNSYLVGVNVTGLESGNSIILENNGGNTLEVNTNNSLTYFSQAIGDGMTYSVSILSQPTSPNQTCLIEPGNETGTIKGADVSITVTCDTETYFVGVTVTGLVMGNSVILENNDGDELIVSSNDILSNFSQEIVDGSDYLVLFNTQPTSPNQICSIASGQETGTINGAEVNIAVTCEIENYNVGVLVTGLELGNSVQLENNGADAIEINSNNVLTNFSQVIADEMAYIITVNSQPTSPNQLCVITDGEESGIINGSDVISSVMCVTNSYNIGVTVDGLEIGNSVFLENNGGNLLEVIENGVLTNFSQPIGDALDYSVNIASQPTNPNQTCRIEKGLNSGTVTGEDINIPVSCGTNSYNIGVTVDGLSKNNSLTVSISDQSLVFNKNTTLVFATPFLDGSNYNAIISEQPNMPSQYCQIFGGNGTKNNGSGTLNGSDIELSVSCANTPISVNNTFTLFQLMLLISFMCFIGYKSKQLN